MPPILTYHPDLVLGDDSRRGRATGHFLFVFRVCRARLGQELVFQAVKCGTSLRLPPRGNRFLFPG